MGERRREWEGRRDREEGERRERERERKARGIVYGGKAATTARGHLPTTSETLQPPSATTSILWSSLAPHPPSAWPGLGWAAWPQRGAARHPGHSTLLCYGAAGHQTVHPLQPCRWERLTVPKTREALFSRWPLESSKKRFFYPVCADADRFVSDSNYLKSKRGKHFSGLLLLSRAFNSPEQSPPSSARCHIYCAPRALTEPRGGSQETWFSSHLHLDSPCDLDKSRSLSGPQFPHLQNGGSN